MLNDVFTKEWSCKLGASIALCSPFTCAMISAHRVVPLTRQPLAKHLMSGGTTILNLRGCSSVVGQNALAAMSNNILSMLMATKSYIVMLKYPGTCYKACYTCCTSRNVSDF